jgi:hypothetical protein
MLFLANENFPLPSIRLLRKAGLGVDSIAETIPGISDQEVISQATLTGAVILTFDKDYGEIIFKLAATPPPGVVYFRHKSSSPLAAGEVLLKLISQGMNFKDMFTVIGSTSLRQKRLNG